MEPMVEFVEALQVGMVITPNSWSYPNCCCGQDPCAFPETMVEVTCAFGHQARLVDTKHKIAQDGTVSPSVVCVRPGCKFHEFIRLLGWRGREMQPKCSD